jgi:hypothetical protein
MAAPTFEGKYDAEGGFPFPAFELKGRLTRIFDLSYYEDRLANPKAVHRLRISHTIACHEEMDYRNPANGHCRGRAANPQSI